MGIFDSKRSRQACRRFIDDLSGILREEERKKHNACGFYRNGQFIMDMVVDTSMGPKRGHQEISDYIGAIECDNNMKEARLDLLASRIKNQHLEIEELRGNVATLERERYPLLGIDPASKEPLSTTYGPFGARFTPPDPEEFIRSRTRGTFPGGINAPLYEQTYKGERVRSIFNERKQLRVDYETLHSAHRDLGDDCRDKATKIQHLENETKVAWTKCREHEAEIERFKREREEMSRTFAGSISVLGIETKRGFIRNTPSLAHYIKEIEQEAATAGAKVATEQHVSSVLIRERDGLKEQLMKSEAERNEIGARAIRYSHTVDEQRDEIMRLQRLASVERGRELESRLHEATEGRKAVEQMNVAQAETIKGYREKLEGIHQQTKYPF
jgi:hypothetical protein